MGRITIKGGVWKNTEDEILKAAVMKYGMNQWARVSSLLVRKSAKQCKARWQEWLDPSIKKTEWSREEEEKLLHLAKIMPCQWRTIAPMLNRTAAQCLEHYEHLLDAAQQPEVAAAAAAGAAPKPSVKDRLEDPRRLRPGEIDPLPEAKPARPDPEDMDEDELEMLSEARARLANTKGKKAKRKAREKQLEEARRLTVLQRQRELKAAGIEQKPLKKRKAGIDYLEEIPFEKQAPRGFYAVDDENEESTAKKVARGFKPVNLQDVEGKSRAQTEAEERKKDAKRLKLFKETALPDALLKINQLNDPQQISRRMELALPAPMVSDRELSDIAKLSGGNLVAAIAGGGATPARPGLGPGATPARTAVPMRTPIRPDTILLESQNLLTITNANSSLLGGENAPLAESDFSGVKPRATAVATPNPLATPMHGAATPRSAVPSTPMRDGLGINAPSSETALSAAQAIAASRSRAEGRRAASKLASALSSLPAPQNQFALVLPELPKEAPDSNAMEEDAEEALARAQSLAAAQREAAWRAESQVIQRSLPRPVVLNAAYALEDPVEMEIENEMMRLVRYDAAKHPLDASKKPVKMSKLSQLLAPFTESELASARALVEAELAAAHGHLTEAERKILFQSLDLSSWDAHIADSLFIPAQKSFGLISEAKKADDQSVLLDAYAQQFELTRASVQNASKKASKLEQNLSVQLGGYQAINSRLRTETAQLHAQLVDTVRSQSCFQMLAANEANAIPMRTQQLQALVREQQEHERELQRTFKLLSEQAEALGK